MKKKPARRIDFNQRKKRIGNILHFELAIKYNLKTILPRSWDLK